MTSPEDGLEGLWESRILFDASLDAMVLATPQGAVLAANPVACRLLGRTEAQLQAVDRSEVLDGTDPRLARALTHLDRNLTFTGELRLIRADGTVFPAEVASSVFQGPGGRWVTTLSFRDISERKRTEAALRASEERFSKAFHTSPDGITISRRSDGCYLDVNTGFATLSGYTAEEVLGKTSVELNVWMHSEDRESFVRALKDHGEVVNWEVDFRFKGGVIRRTLVSARPMELNGEACILSTTRDITDRKLAEEQLALEKARLAESLVRTQRLESLGLLAGGIAHDFNNMLGGIFGFLELARVQLEAGHIDKALRHLERALGIHGRAKGLTRQLLTFAKGGAPLRESLRLEALLRHNVAFALSGSNLTCVYDLPADLWPCEGDQDQLGQVIDNLVLNAKQAMGEGGVLSVAARNRWDPPDHPGAYVQISVTDQGPGIPPESLAKIFDPFFTTKATGHGLGLSTVFSIVRRHDGWVDVESQLGQGATFHVYLPASQRSPEAPEGPSNEHHGSGSILILDDEASLREILAGLLQTLGYTTVECRRGQEAVALYQAAHEAGTPFVAVILDLTIPGDLGGGDAARSIRALDPGAVLVAASGYSDGPIFHTPEAFGFSGRIAKPYLRADLSEVLSRLLGPKGPVEKEGHEVRQPVGYPRVAGVGMEHLEVDSHPKQGLD